MSLPHIYSERTLPRDYNAGDYVVVDHAGGGTTLKWSNADGDFIKIATYPTHRGAMRAAKTMVAAEAAVAARDAVSAAEAAKTLAEVSPVWANQQAAARAAKTACKLESQAVFARRVLSIDLLSNS